MHMRILPIAVAAIAITLASTYAPSANAGVSAVHTGQPSSRVHVHLPSLFCHKQLANDNGTGIVSQNFETQFDAYDSRGADDFTLTKSCTVAQVRVNGAYFNGSGPADSVNVNFFKSQSSGAVGRNIFQRHNQAYSDPSGTGNFNIVLSRTVTLAPGKYWVSVGVDMSFGAGGEWGWNTNNVAKGSNSNWQNPGGGFGTGCTKWGETITCIPSGEGPDFAFALEK